MDTLSNTDLLKYLRVQMAAEALYDFDATGQRSGSVLLTPGDRRKDERAEDFLTVENLTTGNWHASKFTQIDAEQFVSEWTLVDEISNTSTGFSGTLMKNNNTGEYVLSCRSTEFIDDAARDSEATNQLEIQQHGWAFGQIADMEDWYQQIKDKIDGPLTVTGYSLGGHLATAFHLLHPELFSDANAANKVVTFNGAGVGTLNGSLTDMVATFNNYRNGNNESLFESSAGRSLYETFNAALKSALSSLNSDISVDFVDNLIAQCNLYDAESASAEEIHDRNLLKNALRNIEAIVQYNDKVAGFHAGNPNPAAPQQPALIHDGQIGQESLDYQLAVFQTSDLYHTSGASKYNLYNLYKFGNKTNVYPTSTQYDAVGTEMDGTGNLSMVSYSQNHYGTNIPVFVEDQPQWRGDLTTDIANLGNLVDNYYNNDFGDTHSLVLQADSLRVASTFEKLDPSLSRSVMNSIFMGASSVQAKTIAGTAGRAEGDVLENVVNALAAQILGPQAWSNRTPLKGSLSGNTWANVPDDPVDGVNYTGRDSLYQLLNDIEKKPAFTSLLQLAQSNSVHVSDQMPSAADAATNFGAFIALQTLSPFTLQISGDCGDLYTAWGSEYTKWQADCTVRADASISQADKEEKLNFTDQYLSAKADYLAELQNANRQNTAFAVTDVGHPDYTMYEDFSTNRNLLVTPHPIIEGIATASSNANQVTFGGSDDDLLEGSKKSDSIFGGAGNDVINGGGGNDYLEGDDGDDSITAGSGNDTLLGGDGNDTLDGGDGDNVLYGGDGDDRLIAGSGIDTLYGGNGDDTYWIKSGTEIKFIKDSDGEGTVYLDQNALTGGKKDPNSNNKWISGDKKVTYTLVDMGNGNDDLWIQTDNQKIVIERWSQDKNLGITLEDTKPPAPPANGGGNVISGTGALYGTPGDDTFLPGNAYTVINATQGGNDTVIGGAETDYVRTGDGNNVVEGHNGQDIVLSGSGNDAIYVDAKVDFNTAIKNGTTGTATKQKGSLISAGNGNNTVIGGAGNDEIDYGNGNNLIVLGSGNSTVFGGSIVAEADTSWTQTAKFSTANSVGVELFNTGVSSNSSGGYNQSANYEGNWVADVPVGVGSATIYGGSGNSLIFLGNGKNYVNAENGNNSVYGGNESDTIFGGSGNGVLSGKGGDDLILAQSGNHLIVGGAGNNTIYGGTGSETIYAGDDDTFALTSTPDGYWKNAQTGANRVFGGTGKTTIYGSGGNDSLYAGSGDTTIYGGLGHEYIVGGSGNCELYSGSFNPHKDNPQSSAQGKDTLIAGDGNTTIVGGDGNDVLKGGDGVDVIKGSSGDYEIWAGDGGTSIDNATKIYIGDGNSTVHGGNGVDLIQGGAGNDEIWTGNGGKAGNPTAIQMGSGNTTIYGGSGVVQIQGGGGSDVIYAGSGSSTILCGPGNYDINLSANTGTVYVAGVSGSDTIHFDESVSVANISVSRVSDSSTGALMWEIDSPDGQLLLDDNQAGLVRFKLADGSTYRFSDLTAKSGYYNDGQGYTVARDYASDDTTLVDDAWNNSLLNRSGTDVFNSDGSKDGTTNLDGGSVLTTHSDISGNFIARLRGASGDLTSIRTFTTDGSGNTDSVTTDASGNKLDEEWTKSDGSSGSVVYTGNGASTSKISYSDGSTATIIDDGQGHVTTTKYDASGVMTGSSEKKPDGSTDTLTINSDGTSVSVVDDGQGNVRTSYLDASGVMTNDVWTKSDGSHGEDTINGNAKNGTIVNADGTYSTYTDDGQGDTLTTEYDAQGNKRADASTNADGSSSQEVFNSDGSSSGRTDYVDGSYTQYQDDGSGDRTTTHFDASGNRVSDSWNKSDGSSGTDKYFKNGSYIALQNNSDGSSSKTYGDAKGDTYSQIYDAYGQEIEESWHNADGSGGTTTIDPSTGTRTTTLVDASGNPIQSSAGSSSGMKGSFYREIMVAGLESEYEAHLVQELTQNLASQYNQIEIPDVQIVTNNDPIVPGETATGSVLQQSSVTKTVTMTRLVPHTTTSLVHDHFIPAAETIGKTFDLATTEWVYSSSSGSDRSGTVNGQSLVGVWIDKEVSSTQWKWETETTSSIYTTASLGAIEQIEANVDGQTILLGQGQEVVNAAGNGDLIGPDTVTASSFNNSVNEPIIYDIDWNNNQQLLARYGVSQIGSFINAYGANDTVIGGLGNDTIVCGGGNDFINGGGGNDTFLVFPEAAHGWDVINDTLSMENDPSSLLPWVTDWYGYYGGSLTPAALTNTFEFESGLTPDQLQFSWSRVAEAGNQLALNISWGGDGGIRIVMRNEENASFVFQNGMRMSMADILNMAPPMPNDSTLAVTQNLSALSIDADLAFSYTLPKSLFVLGTSDSASVKYSVALADGTPLPGWMIFNPLTRTLSGVVPDGWTQNLQLSVIGQVDASSQAVTAPLALNVSDVDSSADPVTQISTNDDGTYSITSNMKDGKVIVRNYSASGILASINWNATDGTSGMTTYNADGSYSGQINALSGSHTVIAKDLAGKVVSSEFSSSGVLTGDYWNMPDGSYGYDVYNQDGSSSGKTVNADGSYSESKNDGHANLTAMNYDASGQLLSQTWSKADGTNGTTFSGADGSSSGVIKNADGTYSTFTNDGHGNVGYKYYAADDVQTGYGSSAPDGSSVRYNFDGTKIESQVDASGNTISRTYSSSGDLVADAWNYTNGLNGRDTQNADGTVSGQWSNQYGAQIEFNGNAALGGVVASLDLLRDRLVLTTGNSSENLIVDAGANQIILGSGNNSVVIASNASADIAVSQGDTTITNNGYSGKVNLGDYAPDHIWLSQSSADLVINVLGQNEQVTIKNWFDPSTQGFETLQAGDKQLAWYDVNRLVSAMAAFAPPSASQTALTSQEQQQLAPTLAISWS